MAGILIILGDAFADLRCRDANDGSEAVSYSRSLPKISMPRVRSLMFAAFPRQRLFDDKAQESREPLTVAEIGTGQ